MINLVIGLLMASGLLTTVVALGRASASTFVNSEGVIIVFGGTLAILLLNTRFYDMKFFIKNFFKLVNIQDNKKDLKQTLISCSKAFEKGAIPNATGEANIDGAIEWIATGLRGKELEKLLEERKNVQLDMLYRCASILQNLSKYPPALGMIGTVVGIISVFQGLGQEGGQSMLGHNLAIAMSSTLYGLVLANFVINPIAELVIQSIQKKEEEINLISETIKMWAQKENSIYIQEHIELYDIA